MALVPRGVIELDKGGVCRPGQSWVVWIEWSGEEVDRPRTHGINVGNKLALAKRLVKAIDAGVVHHDISIATDVEGRTYVDATCRVMGKYLNADLKRLGY